MKLTTQMITDELLWRFKRNIERMHELENALAAATTEEQKRAICEQFKASAEAERDRWLNLAKQHGVEKPSQTFPKA